MFRSECRHPAAGLLPWYLNGSLDDVEAAPIGQHLTSCSVCRAQLEALSELSLAIERHGLPTPSTVLPSFGFRNRRIFVGAAISAALLLASLIALPPRSPHPGVELDLDSGAVRSTAPVPSLTLTSDIDEIRASFFLPPAGGRDLRIEMRRRGEASARWTTVLPPCDRFGRCRVVVPGDSLRLAGEYELVVLPATGEGRVHRYPFVVEVER